MLSTLNTYDYQFAINIEYNMHIRLKLKCDIEHELHVSYLWIKNKLHTRNEEKR